MKNKNDKQQNNKRNVEFSRELDCCEKNANVEFANEFNNHKKKHPNNKAKKSNANVTRTNAYAGITEYANELGTARNAVDTLGNDPVTSDFRNITTQSSPYPYAEYEFGNEPFYGDNHVDARDFSDLENARKSYFERLNRDRNQRSNKKNS